MDLLTIILQKIIFFTRGNLFIPDMKIFWKRNSVNFLKNYISENNIAASTPKSVIGSNVTLAANCLLSIISLKE